MAGMNLGFLGGAAGAAEGLDQVLARRLKEKLLAQQEAQRMFENSVQQRQLDQTDASQRLNEQLRRDQLTETARGHTLTDQQHQETAANNLAEQLGGSFVPSGDPAVGMLRTGGRGGLLGAEQGALPALGSQAQQSFGVLRAGDTGAARPAGFQMAQTPKQVAGQAEEQRKTAADTDRQRHELAMEKAAAGRGQPTAQQDNMRVDRSYALADASLKDLRKPVADQAERLSRLVDSVNQGTPQADALVAPELLTAMAGGQGSGLRMNEAEISRIVGGRSNWEGLKAAANKWQLDPSKALSITPAQRQQIRALLGTVHQRVQEKLGVLDQASQDLIEAPNVEAHRRIVAGARAAITRATTSQTSQTTEPKVGDRKTFPNGKTGVFDGQGWVQQ